MSASRTITGTRAQGFMLIETLIAFVILSVGVLGVVSLILMSKSAQHQAVQRVRAVNLADAIVERIRINPSAMSAYDTGSDPLGSGTIKREPTPDCRTAACTPAQLANHDLWAWEQALDGADAVVDGENVGGLISAKGCITFTPVNGRANSGELRVDLQWRGLVEATDAVQSGEVACGGEIAGVDNYRRKVVVQTLVIDEEDL